MKVNTYCTGYFYYEVNRYFTKIDDCFKLFGDGVFNYKDVIEQDCFDEKGNSLGVFETEERYTKKEKGRYLETNWAESVIQIDYNFYKIKHGASTMDEVATYESLLSNSNLINSPGFISNEYRFESNEINHYYHNDRTYYTYSDYEPFEMVEICYTGFSQRILNTTNKKLYNLDIKEYTKRKNDFIKDNPDLKEMVENIYMHNMVYLMRFWKLTKKQLLSNRKKTLDLTINKLNRKINFKQARS